MNINCILSLVFSTFVLWFAGSFSAAQEMERIFSRIDRNGDGMIGQDEIPEKAKQRIMNLDKDGDGSISRDEMVAMQGMRNQLGRGGDGTNGRGKNEKARKRPGAEKMSAEGGDVSNRFKQLLQRADKNQDGVLELAELPEQLRQRLSNLDKNQDGKFTIDEMKAASGSPVDRTRLRRSPDGARPSAKEPSADGAGNLRFEKMMETLPRNKDGLIDLEAIEDQERRDRLSKLDANGDQLLDRQELREFVEKMKARGIDQPGFDPKKKRSDKMVERGSERAPQMPKRPDRDNSANDDNN
jgi:Ca2+-binding EF-hand superfamily protein